MTKPTMALSELLAKSVSRGIAEAVLQLMMEFEREAIHPVDRRSEE